MSFIAIKNLKLLYACSKSYYLLQFHYILLESMVLEDYMREYTDFAYVYDEYMDNIPYDEWCAYLIQLLREYHINSEDFIVDLGCGTGTVTRILDKAGYDCIGIDMSQDMLTIASEKTIDNGQEIVYSLQDMREFSLPYEASAMISIGDSMNYITSVSDLKSVFKSVKEGLALGGIFIFDLKTIHFFRDILSDNTYAQDRDTSAFIWNNYYENDTKNNIYDLIIFVENEDGLFERFEEQHFQHGFEIDEVKNAAQEAGLEVVAIYDAFTHNEPNKDSERLYYIIKNNI